MGTYQESQDSRDANRILFWRGGRGGSGFDKLRVGRIRRSMMEQAEPAARSKADSNQIEAKLAKTAENRQKTHPNPILFGTRLVGTVGAGGNYSQVLHLAYCARPSFAF